MLKALVCALVISGGAFMIVKTFAEMIRIEEATRGTMRGAMLLAFLAVLVSISSAAISILWGISG